MKTTLARSCPRLFMFIMVLTLLGCESGDEEKTPTYTSLWNSTFSSCGVNCHSPTAADGTDNGPDLSSKSSFYSNLVGKNVDSDYPSWASYKTGNCNNINFITPGDAAQSTVVTSLIESYSINQTSCVSSFNLHAVNNTTITDKATQDALVAWINDGAKNN